VPGAVPFARGSSDHLVREPFPPAARILARSPPARVGHHTAWLPSGLFDYYGFTTLWTRPRLFLPMRLSLLVEEKTSEGTPIKRTEAVKDVNAAVA